MQVERRANEIFLKLSWQNINLTIWHICIILLAQLRLQQRGIAWARSLFICRSFERVVGVIRFSESAIRLKTVGALAF